MSFPLAISFTVGLNERNKHGGEINMNGGVFACIFGFLSSYLMPGTNMLFRAVSASQVPIIADGISEFGPNIIGSLGFAMTL